MISDEEKRTLAQIQVLQELDLPKEQLEATLISLLQWVYGEDDIKIINHLDYMDRVRNKIKIVD